MARKAARIWTPISPARSSDRPGGFTLIELMIVLGLLSVVMFIAVPAFQSLLQGQLQRETNRLAGVVHLLRNEAVLSRTTYRLLFYMDEGRYAVEQRDSFGSFIPVNDPPMLRPHELPKGLKLEAMFLFGEPMRHRKGEPIPIVVDPSGFVDPFVLQLLDGDEPYTFKVTGFTGKVALEEGHVEK